MTVETVNILPTEQPTADFGDQTDTVTWSTYRSFLGTVTFTLTDVEAGGSWDYCNMTIWLLDSDGNVWGSGSLTKYWGQNASCGLGTINPSRSLRLRTKLNIMLDDGEQYADGTWTATLSWNTSVF